jgi:hypothetical protein
MPASRSHCTAVMAWRVSCVRTTGTTRARRNLSINSMVFSHFSGA